MIAYDHDSVKTRSIYSLGSALENAEVISEEENATIKESYKNDGLTPNPYLKILLFGVSAVVPIAIVGLIDPEEISSFYLFALIYWGVAELLIRWLKLYHSGIEEGIVSVAVVLFCIALQDTILAETTLARDFLLYFLIVFVFLAFVATRYRMWIFIYATYLVSFIVVFYFFLWAIYPAYYLFQFGIAGLSVLVFWLCRRVAFRENLFLHPITGKLEVLSLVTAFVAFNPYLMSEIFFGYNDLTLDYFPLFGLNLAVTIMGPIFLIYFGAKKVNRLLLNIGAGWAAIALLTIWYYYLQEIDQNLLALSTGLSLVALGLVAHRKLKDSRPGFVSFRIKTQESFNIFNSLIRWTKRLKLNK